MDKIKMPAVSGYDAVVLADGSYPSADLPLQILGAAGKIVCCDGASTEFVRRGGRPFAIVGDCDSLLPETVSEYGRSIFKSVEQETNDLTKAVVFCRDRGMKNICILGATGKREDHTVGNISLLVDYFRMGLAVTMITDHGVFTPFSGPARFEGRTRMQVSIFTVDSAVKITTRGLKFPLENSLLRGWWPGTLNECLGEEFSVKATAEALVYRVFGS